MSTWVVPVLLHCGRTLRGWTRTPAVVANGFVMPVVMLSIVLLIFGQTIEAISAVDPVNRLVPLMIASAVLFAGIASAVALVTERRSGLHERFSTLPNPRLAPLLGRVCAEVVRALCSAVVVLALGVGLGFRSTPVGFVLILVLTACFALAIGTFITWIGMTASSPESVMAVTPLLMIMLFLNTGFVPLEGFPEAIRPVVAVNPLSAVAEAMIAAADGDLGPRALAGAAAWCLGLTALGAVLLARTRRP